MRQITTNNRPSFLLYKSFYAPIKHLKDEELGMLFRVLFEYQDGLEVKNLPPQIGMAFAFFKNQFDLDEQKYQITVDRNKSNGSKGGRPKKEETQANPENPVGFLEPRKAEKEKEKEKEIEKDKRKRFAPPSLQDIQNYCKERNNSVSASKFFDYYSAGEWKDKDGKAVKNWKQKLLSWEGRDTTTGSTATPKDSFAESINQQIGQDLVASVTEKPDHVQVSLHSATACDKWMKIPQATRDEIAQQVRAKFSKEPKLKF